MPDPTGGMYPPMGVNPAAWLEMMRQQQLAGTATGAALTPDQPQMNGRMISRVSPLSPIAKMATALMARRMQGRANDMQAQIMRGMGGGGQQGQQQPQGQEAPPPDPYAPVSQEDIANVNVPGLPPAGSIPFWAQLQHQDPVKAMETYRTQQKGVLAQQHAPAISKLDGLIQSDHPAQYVLADSAFMQHWPALAQSMQVDPQQGFNDQNVRRALGMIRNPLAASVGMPEKQIPEQPIPVKGAYGYRGEKNPVTGEEKQIQGAELPSYGSADVYDPKTGTTQKNYFQTGGWFPGMSRFGSGQGGGGSPAGPSNVNLGMGQPKPDEFQSAGYAQYMRGGMQGLRSLETEGFELDPAVRAVIIDTATAEEGGLTMQTVRQELLKHGLGLNSAKAQQYMASLMPVMQAAGHAMAGARLTAGQMRTNFESLIPVDTKNKNALQQIEVNRQNYYRSLLGQAGAAVHSPLYNESLGADYDKLGQGPQRRQINGKWYEQRNDGQIYEVKAP